MEFKKAYYLIGMLVVLIIHTLLLNVWLNNEPPASKRVGEDLLEKHKISTTSKRNLLNRKDSLTHIHTTSNENFSVALK